MFDPVTTEVLRRRRLAAPPPAAAGPEDRRTSLVCSVCGREVRPEEEVFWVDMAVHCFQCHSMLEYELDEDRKREETAKRVGTKWQREGTEPGTE